MNTIEASLRSKAHSGLINKFFHILFQSIHHFLIKSGVKTWKVNLIAGRDYLAIECYIKINLENLI